MSKVTEEIHWCVEHKSDGGGQGKHLSTGDIQTEIRNNEQVKQKGIEEQVSRQREQQMWRPEKSWRKDLNEDENESQLLGAMVESNV